MDSKWNEIRDNLTFLKENAAKNEKLTNSIQIKITSLEEMTLKTTENVNIRLNALKEVTQP